jgi:hypothetical protein
MAPKAKTPTTPPSRERVGEPPRNEGETEEDDNLYLFPGVDPRDLYPDPPRMSLRGLRERLREIVLYSDSTPVEFISGSFATLWGLWVGNPFTDLYVEFPVMYAGAKSIAPEWLWGSWALTVGLCQILGLLFRKPDARRQGAFLGVILWNLASFAAYKSAVGTTAPVFYPLLTGISFWSFASSAKVWGAPKIGDHGVSHA